MPKPMTYPERLTIMIGRSTKRDLTRACEHFHLSVSEILRDLIDEFLEDNPMPSDQDQAD